MFNDGTIPCSATVLRVDSLNASSIGLLIIHSVSRAIVDDVIPTASSRSQRLLLLLAVY